MGAPGEAYIFWQHDTPQVIPDNAWTPVGWNLNRASRPSQRAWSDNKFFSATTTIAAGSNGQTLPQATINVADTTGGGNEKLAFASAGYIFVRFGGADRLVKYTGKTATTFTGCTQTGAGTGGAMTTGDAVTQALVDVKAPYAALMNAVAEVHWASNGTGLRGIRFRDTSALQLLAGTTVIGAVAASNPELHIQTTEQPAFAVPTGQNNSSPVRVEVFQNSTAALNILGAVGVGLDSPRLVCCTLTTP